MSYRANRRTDRQTDRRTDKQDDRIKCSGEHLIMTNGNDKIVQPIALFVLFTANTALSIQRNDEQNERMRI